MQQRQFRTFVFAVAFYHVDSLFDPARGERVVVRRAGREPGVDDVSRPPLPLGLRRNYEAK